MNKFNRKDINFGVFQFILKFVVYCTILKHIYLLYLIEKQTKTLTKLSYSTFNSSTPQPNTKIPFLLIIRSPFPSDIHD